MQMQKAFRFGILGLALLCLLGRSLQAQQTLGSINGTVADSSGAVVQDAVVKIHNVATGLEQTAKTKSDGSFSMVDLPIGTYSVTFSRSGFKTEVHSQILVQADRTTTVHGSLQLGEVSAQVTVTASPILNQTDTTNGYVMGSELIESTPLGTGSFTQLALLAPGVSADLLAGSGTNAGLGNQSIWANGQRDTSNSLSLNGVSSNNIFSGKTSSQVASNRVLFNVGEGPTIDGETQTSTSVYTAIGQGIPTPPQETIEEVRVNTSMYDASEGANSGAHVALITKSGTNDLHGQLYEYHQTDAWNAAPFFRNSDTSVPASQKVPKLHRNQFGATLGGPIIKDKLFFFGSYQGVRVSDQLNATSNVVVPAFLTDDRTDAGIIKAVNQSFASCSPNCVTQIDPVARKLLNAKARNGGFLIPSSTDTSGTQNHDVVLTGQPSQFYADQYNANIDYNFSAKDRFAAKYYYQNDPGTNPFAQSQLFDSPQRLDAGSQVISLSNSTFLTPNLTWDQKLGFIRERAYANTKQALSPSDVGMNLLNNFLFPSIQIFTADPVISSGLTIGPTSNFADAGVFQNQFSGSSGLGWTHGRHTVSAGFGFDHTQLNVINRNSQFSQLFFNSFVDFVNGNLQTGAGNSVYFNGASNRYYRANQLGTYVNDSIRLRRNLTVSLGFRYDFEGALVEKNGRLTNFIPSRYKYDFNTDTVVNTGLVVAGNNKAFGTPGVSDSTLLHRQQAFEPRLGIVWSPSFIKNFVIRTGFGLYADRGQFFTELSPSAGGGFNGPFGVTMEPPFTTLVFAQAGASFSAPFGTSAPPPPPTTLAGVNALVQTRPALAGGAVPFIFGGYDPNNKLPYTENWTLDLQWQPRDTLAMTLAYVGNHGVHGTIPVPFNEPKIATQQNPVNGESYSYGYQISGIPQETVNTFDGGNIDLRVPFIGYSASAMFYEAAGNSNYHALQFGVNKRLSHGLLINGSYTWSHSLDMQSGLGLFFTGNDPLKLKSAYGNSDFDRTHVTTVSYLYQFPNLANKQGLESKLVNGWGISGITVLESGQPYSVSDFSGGVAGIYFSNFDNITNPIVSFAPGQNAHTAQLQGTTGVNAGKSVLNPAAFTFPFLPPGTSGVPPCNGTVCDNFETGFGNVGRNVFRGPFQSRFDFAVNKETKLSERFSLKYTAQAFNVFNHPSFDTPNNNVNFNVSFSNPPTFPGPGQPPGGKLGQIQHTIGSPRFIQMALHLNF